MPLTIVLSIITYTLPVIAAPCSPPESQRPTWVNKVPTGYEFDYFVGYGEDESSPVAAKGTAIGNAIGSIVAGGLITVETLTDSRQIEKTRDAQSTLISTISEEVRVKGHSTQVKGLEEVEVHLERCGSRQRAYVLVRIPKRQPESAPSRFSPVWRSILAPSWGQFYKGHSARGVLILAGELILIPAAITTYMLSNNAAREASAATTQALRDAYSDRSEQLWVASLITGGAAAALYIYGIIDAIAAPQDNVYAHQRPAPPPRLRFALLPGPDSVAGSISWSF